MPTLLKLFHKIEREGTLPNSLYEAYIPLISELDKDSRKKRTIGNFFNEHRWKNPQ
jgi:hypothetical protein